MMQRHARRFACLILLAAGLASAPLAAQETPPPDSVPAHDSLTLHSKILGEARLINVHTPAGYETSAAHYPVLYMPDGGIDEDFPHVVNTVDSLIALGRVRPVIVVGIPNTQRRRDLTTATTLGSDSAAVGIPDPGHSEAFRRFIREELIPAIDARYRTTAERSVVGESLAGLFIVEVFLKEPSLFTHYVALDPSLWWNGGTLADSAAGDLARFDHRPRTLFLSSSSVPEITQPTERLAGLLREMHPEGLTWTYVPRPDLTHATIFRGIGPEALAAALH